ncbi:MAG: PLP-dependent aminotransferase family protein [Burkholderiaceae bacterium]|nr:PLP-dependent aminotransferase family protein [Burkholderiaceae bacterium]
MRALSLSELLLIELAQPHDAPLRQRIYELLRRAIIQGVIPGGARLPSSRDLANELNLSRNTVVSAVEQLLAEGYVQARVGSGTYVNESLPEHETRRVARLAKATAPQTPPPAARTMRNLSTRGQRLTRLSGFERLEVQPFSPGDADYETLPFKQLNQLLKKYLSRSRPDLLDCGEPGGYLPLRRALARYLQVSRSVNVTPEQLLITTSTQQSLDLCARLLANEGDEVWLENPCYWGAQLAVEAAGLRPRPIAVDDDGIRPSDNDWLSHPKLIYVTPSNQYPSGAVMSLERRRQLLDFASSRQAWVLEDDYDSEFRYEGRPLPSLQGMDNQGQVIYLGTFSKVMYQGVRLAYMVVPTDLVGPMRTGLYDLFRPGQLAMQAALAEFIEDGQFEANIRRMRVTYGERRAQLLATLRECMGERVRISHSNAGMTMVIYLPEGSDDKAMAAAVARHQMTVRALSDYYLASEQTQRRAGLVVGYAYVATANIEPWARTLAALILSELDSAAALARGAQDDRTSRTR